MSFLRIMLRRLSAGPLLALASLATSAQTVAIGGGATVAVRPGTTLFVHGGLIGQNTGALANQGTVQLTGDFTLASGGSASGPGRLRFSGTQDQTLSAPAGTILANVEQASTGPAGSNRLLVPNNLGVSGQLLLSSGLVRTAPTATLSLPNGASLSGEAAGRYVQGNLRITRATVTGPVDFGHGVVLDGTGQVLGAVSITRTAGLQTAGLSYGTSLGTPVAQGIDRIWTVSPAVQPTTPVPFTLSWLPDDDNGLNGFAQAQLWQQPAAGGPWVAVGSAGNAATRSLTISVLPINRFTLGNAAGSPPPARGSSPALSSAQVALGTAGLGMEAYPMPLHQSQTLRLRIRPASAGPATLHVTDALGRIVLRQEVHLMESLTELALPEAEQWPQGLYLLHLQQGAQQQTAKVVRE